MGVRDLGEGGGTGGQEMAVNGLDLGAMVMKRGKGVSKWGTEHPP